MEWLVVLVAVSLIVGAFAQSVTGLGFSLIAAPAMLALLGPRDGVAMIVVLSALASFIPLTHQWRHIGFRDAGSLLLPTLLATPVVVAALAGADTALVAVGAGIASAVLNVVGGVGGPPVGMYASNAGWAPDHSRATLQFFFLVQNLVTAVVIGFIAPQWWMLAGVVIGTLIGALVAGRIPVPAARMAVLVVAALGGASLVVANV